MKRPALLLLALLVASTVPASDSGNRFLYAFENTASHGSGILKSSIDGSDSRLLSSEAGNAHGVDLYRGRSSPVLPIPEPTSLLLLGTGLLITGIISSALARRRRSR